MFCTGQDPPCAGPGVVIHHGPARREALGTPSDAVADGGLASTVEQAGREQRDEPGGSGGDSAR